MTDKKDPPNTPDDKTRIAKPVKKAVADDATVIAKKVKPVGDDATIIAKKPAKADDSTVLAKNPNKKPKAITDDATVLAKKPKKIADDATVLAAKKTNSDSNHATGSQTAPAKHYTEYRSKTGNNSTGFAKASELAEQALSGSGAGTLLKKRFLLEDALGQGGMGTVYKTKDLRKVEAEDPNPYIATKVLNQDFKDHPDAFVALQQETAKSQTLAHPNIVTVHDFDRDGDILFMTMELLDGEPLDKLLRAHLNQGLPLETAFKLTRDLCAALTYAHKRHLIHADFKPGNVFVMKDGSAKVLDFGIARAATKDAQGHKFDAGQLGALTPAYATVEMMNDEPISFADDVYALGCVVYEMLAGRHPYNSMSALDAQQQKLKPKRIERLSNQQWKALSRAISVEKAQRHATIADFQGELFPRRKPLAFKIAMVLLPISLIGVAWFAYGRYQAQAQIQTTINEKLHQAQSCFAESDFSCAVEQSRVVTNLDPQNSAAISLLENAQKAYQAQQSAAGINSLLREATECFDASDFACSQLKAREVLKLDAENVSAEKLFRESSESLQIAKLVAQGNLCLQNNDLGCAISASDTATAINSNNALALSLRADVVTAKNNYGEQQAQIQEFLSKARACLSKGDYDCTIAQADNIEAISPGNADAASIKQSAITTRQQQQEAQQKVNNILAQARTCLDKQKNYSCAIAKAEAALAIIPNHKEATQIKNTAVETQRKLKSTGFNIQ